jgi:ATP-dependent helicase/nuclease subunit B
LLKLTNEILGHLQSGGTLLVPSRQRATAVRLAFTAAMLEQGRRVWDSPDVLPWTAWLERELDAAREQGAPVPRRLTAMEEWLLWQEAVHEASAGFQILMPDGLIEPVRRAIGLMDDYRLLLRDTPTAEAAALSGAALHFARRCEELNVLGRASWRGLAAFIQPVARLLLAGFATMGPERQRWLEERGARATSAASPSGADATRTLAFESCRDEAEAAATWCASQLALDANARLLVVAPQLTEQRHVWERAFAQRLNPAAILAGRGGGAESNFAIEGGRPLASFRLVTTALHLFSLGTGRGRFEELSDVLRCPYLPVVDGDIRFGLERWLREHNVGSASLTVLLSLKARIARDIGDRSAEALQILVDALQTQMPAGAASPETWAQAWVAQLRACGWPGDALRSDEQQVRMRFDELLGDFAAVRVPAARLDRSEAFMRLQSMARRVAFEPASDDVPVTLSSRLEDPVVSYDGIWVAGLSADVWPPPARPDPLLPLPWQRAAGIPQASAEGQAARARQLLQQWRAAAPECILSFARSSDDLRRDASPLLPDLAIDAPSAATAVAPDTSIAHWLTAQTPMLETWLDETRPVSTGEGGLLKGGTRLLELQSQCPFRAFAELRLEATPLETPQPGVNPRLRGMILHEALDRFWKQTSDQPALQAMSQQEREQVATRSADAAIVQIMAREPAVVAPRLLAREQARTERLIAQLIEWELKRPPFIARILESSQRFQLPGAVLDLRLDRVDQLADGRLVVLDYKTGAAKKFDALADRLPQPQLPAYALATGSRSAAVVTLYIGRDGVKARGLQDQRGRIPHLPTPKEGEPVWTERIERWRQQLELLMAEYLRGDAGLRPQPDACKFCHLHMVCRIDPATLAALDTDPDALEGEDAAAETEEEGE